MMTIRPLIGLMGCAVLCLACEGTERTVPGPEASLILEALSEGPIEAGTPVRVQWSAPEARSVDLTDDAQRRLVLAGENTAEVEAVFTEDTTLRLIARGARSDTEVLLPVSVRPTLRADARVVALSPEAATVEIRWDSLGATTWRLEGAGEGQEILQEARGTLSLSVPLTEAGSVELRLIATDAEGESADETMSVELPGAAAGRGPDPYTGPTIGEVSPGAPHVYTLEVPEGGAIQAHLSAPDGACPEGLGLALYGPDHELSATRTGASGCAVLAGEADASAPGAFDLPAGAWQLEIFSAADTPYLLQAEVQAPTCGNGRVERRAGELCEPGLHPEACDEACQPDALVESEPNDEYRSAQPISLGERVMGRLHGGIEFERDVYVVDLPNPSHVAVQVTGPGLDGCDYYANFRVILENGSGRTIYAMDEVNHLGEWCGLLTGAETPAPLPAGRLYVRIEADIFEPVVEPVYFFTVEAVPRPFCGDGVITGDEGCDDGNTRSGDGCSQRCEPEPEATLTQRPEPYVFESEGLEAGGALTLTLHADDRAMLMLDVSPEVGCEALEGDLRVMVDGAVLADDHVGFCPSMDHAFAFQGPERLTIQLKPQPGRSVGPFTVIARLISLERPQCGDLWLNTGAGERCDDGNQIDGDGCSAECALEATPDRVVMPGEIPLPPLTARGAHTAVAFDLAEPDTLISMAPQPDAAGLCPSEFQVIFLDEAQTVLSQRITFGGRCGTGSLRVSAPGRYFAVLRQAGRAPIDDITLNFERQGPRCGDGVRTDLLEEVCDDGNEAVGDGCSDACVLEDGVLSEIEPNDTPETATPMYTREAADETVEVRLAGHTADHEDVDLFLIENPTDQPMALQAAVTRGGMCEGSFDLTLLDAEGMILAQVESTPLVGRCVELSPEEVPALGALPPGSTWLQIASDRRNTHTWFLDARFSPEVQP